MPTLPEPNTSFAGGSELSCPGYECTVMGELATGFHAVRCYVRIQRISWIFRVGMCVVESTWLIAQWEGIVFQNVYQDLFQGTVTGITCIRHMPFSGIQCDQQC